MEVTAAVDINRDMVGLKADKYKNYVYIPKGTKGVVIRKDTLYSLNTLVRFENLMSIVWVSGAWLK